MPRSCVIKAAVVAMLLPAQAHAESIPAALRGKSIVASWTENRLQRWLSEGDEEFEPHSVASRIEVYLSTDGRIFERRLANSGSVAKLGGGTASSAAGATTRFSGRSLQSVGASPGGGGRSITVQFDPGFSTCTVRVVIGRGPSGTVRGRSASTKEPIEFKPTGTTNETCSIRDGNVFN